MNLFLPFCGKHCFSIWTSSLRRGACGRSIVVSRDVKFRLCRDGLMFWKDWWTELQPQQFLSLHQLKESDRMWTSAGFMTLRRKAAVSFVVRLHQRLILHIPNMFHEQATKHAVWMLPGYHWARNRRKGHEGIRTVLVPGSGTGSTRLTDRQTESQHIYVVLPLRSKCLYVMRFTSALTNLQRSRKVQTVSSLNSRLQAGRPHLSDSCTSPPTRSFTWL